MLRRVRNLTLIAAFSAVVAPWPSRAEPVVPVEVATARLVPVVIEIPLTGTVTARDHASLSSRVSGLVSAVHVTAGDRVEKGALLLSLDPTLEKLGLAEAEAASAEAQAGLDEARRRRGQARRRTGRPARAARAPVASLLAAPFPVTARGRRGGRRGPVSARARGGG